MTRMDADTCERRRSLREMGMVERMVSGGQSGADRAALDFAIEADIPHGGWCPRGRLAEDGPIDSRYQLDETPDRDYVQRTEWNVRDSDGTVIFSIAERLVGGSAFTRKATRLYEKPCLCLSRDLSDPDDAARELRDFIAEHEIRTLNVAGQRASGEPEIGAFVRATLERALKAAS